jgi:hypothetical protein
MTRLFSAYFVQRVNPRVYIPLIFGLWLAALWAAGERTAGGRLALSLVLIALLILQYRLWDDLEDVEPDRRVHPERVLTQAAAPPFRWLLAALAAMALAMAAAAGATVLAAVTTVDVVFLAAYRVIRPHVPEVVWRYPLLLAKYPAFVLLAAMTAGLARPNGRTALAMLVAMTGACMYEALHDPRRPTGARS